MIIGEDPRKRTMSSHQARRADRKGKSSQVSAISQFFDLKSRVVGANLVSEEDRYAFRMHLIRMVSSGMSRQTLRRNIEVFFSESRFQTHPCPWKAFVSNDTQAYLMQKADTQVKAIDPALQWVLNDFDRDGLDLFWNPDEDTAIRNLFLGYPQIVFRYPEFVISLLEKYSVSETRQVMAEVDDLIMRVLETGRALRLKSALLAKGVPLPAGIASQTTLRPKAQTLAIAIARSQR